MRIFLPSRSKKKTKATAECLGSGSKKWKNPLTHFKVYYVFDHGTLHCNFMIILPLKCRIVGYKGCIYISFQVFFLIKPSLSIETIVIVVGLPISTNFAYFLQIFYVKLHSYTQILANHAILFFQFFLHLS